MNSEDVAMDRYAKGDMSAFHVVYDAVAPRLERHLRRRTRDRCRIEDIIQQTFLEIHRARGTFIAGAAVMPWALAIATNVAITQNRRATSALLSDLTEDDAKLLLELVATPPSSDSLLEARQICDRLTVAYERLTELQREAFALVTLDGLSQAEAAAILGTTLMAVKLRIRNARLALKATLLEGDAHTPMPKRFRASCDLVSREQSP